MRIANIAGVLGVAVTAWVMEPASGAAQPPYDYGSVVYEAARNKIGLMRYCRNNALLSVGIADKAAAAVQWRLLRTARRNALAKEKGDIAEKAGESGFWEASRRRDMAGIAKLFGTTPARLCQEWAHETLRTMPPSLLRDVMAAPRPQPLPAPRDLKRPVAAVAREAPEAGDKQPMPVKAPPAPAQVAEVTKPPEPQPTAAEPTVNWATGPIVVWTRTERRVVRPPRE